MQTPHSEPLQPGLHENVPAAVYHADPALSSGKLREEHPTALHLLAHLDNTGPRKETPEMRLGSLLHMAVLEPDRFRTDTVAGPDFGNQSFKVNKQKKAAFLAEHAGKIVIPEPEHKLVSAMAESIFLHPGAATLLKRKGRNEITAVADDPETKLRLRGRIDRHAEGFALLDLKTAHSANRRQFMLDAYRAGYHRQAAMYEKLWSWITGVHEIFTTVVVENTPPHAVAVFSYSPEDIALGWEDIRLTLRTIAHGRKTGEWPGYPSRVMDLGIPTWARSIPVIGNLEETHGTRQDHGRGRGGGAGQDGAGGFTRLPDPDPFASEPLPGESDSFDF